MELIQGAKNRGHRAYANIDMKRAAQKAKDLPENGVPECLIHLLPHDNHFDKKIFN